MSNIEWTEVTWNPTVGCDKVSAGCKFCYAEIMANRLANMKGRQVATDYAGTVEKTKGGHAHWTGQINLLDHRLLMPATLKKPTIIFPGSMSDLFHDKVPFEFLDKIFAVMALCPQHIFQVLTKRPARALEYLDRIKDGDYVDEAAEIIAGENPHLFYVVEKMSKEAKKHDVMPGFYITNQLLPHLKQAGWYSGNSYGEFGKEHEFFCEGDWPPQHIWIGTSIEDQENADRRRLPLAGIADLGWQTWVSNEPMIGPVSWGGFEFIKWMVTGGESGANARPMHPDWARKSRLSCAVNNIPFFFKQWGAWAPVDEVDPSHDILSDEKGNLRYEWICINRAGETSVNANKLVCQEYERSPAIMYKFGKHTSGRKLDGGLHDAMPLRNSQIAKQ